MIGDRESDLQAGAAAGSEPSCPHRSRRVRPTSQLWIAPRLRLELVASNLADAVRKCGLADRGRMAA